MSLKNAAAAIRGEMSFAPLDLVDARVGSNSLKLYPTISKDMPVWERGHAFQVNKAALANLPADISLVLDAFGAQLNSSSTVEGIISDWRRFFLERWMDFAHLSILSFHRSDGNRIDDTSTAADPSVLLPIVDGARAASRKQDVKFVRVNLMLDFATRAGLITVAPYPVSTILRASFYIELPQGSRQVIDGNGNPYQLVSFLGADNLRTLTRDEVQIDILDIVQQSGPMLLRASDFNLNVANTDAHDIARDIDQKILKMAWHQICASVFEEICTGYTNQPQAALDHIKQSFVDAEGNTVCIPVYAYYQRMMSAMRPFASDERFPKSVCNALIDGMDGRLLRVFRKYYADHSVLHDLSATFQRERFRQILAAMQTAEDEVHSISDIARESIGGQAFAITAYPSQCERTLERYPSGGGYSSGEGYRSDGGYRSEGGRSDTSRGSRGGYGRNHKCFGCGSTQHPWIKDKVIVCPNKDKPGVKEAAEKNYQEYIATSRKRNKKRKESKDKPFDYSSLSAKDKAAAREGVLADLCIGTRTDEASTITQDSIRPSDRPRDPKQAKMTILVVNVAVLSSNNDNKSLLPAPIVTNFPHILLQLGTELDCPKCPVLRCVVDTAAALTTGNFHFVAAVAKRYPHCVAKIFVPEDYNPIVLSGIVQRGGESVSTELTVGFQFHLPYLTRDGSPTSIVIATGPHVTVNLIVGLPFIQATRAIIDMSDDVADLRELDAPPFPIEYRRATVHVPVIEEGADRPVHLSASESAIVQDVERLEAYFSNIDVGLEEAAYRRVSFGSSPGKSFPSFTPPPTPPNGFVDSSMEYYRVPGMGPDSYQ